jgi:hypothetical protein
MQVGDFHISTVFHHNWPYQWSVKVQQTARAAAVTKTWTAWQRNGRWFGGLSGAQAKMDEAVAEAEAYVDKQVARFR